MLTRAEFRQHAKPLVVQVNAAPMGAMPKEFSTGSLGWYVGQKMDILVNGQPVKCQVGINITIVDSKKIPA